MLLFFTMTKILSTYYLYIAKNAALNEKYIEQYGKTQSYFD